MPAWDWTCAFSWPPWARSWDCPLPLAGGCVACPVPSRSSRSTRISPTMPTSPPSRSRASPDKSSTIPQVLRTAELDSAAFFSMPAKLARVRPLPARPAGEGVRRLAAPDLLHLPDEPAGVEEQRKAYPASPRTASPAGRAGRGSAPAGFDPRVFCALERRGCACNAAFLKLYKYISERHPGSRMAMHEDLGRDDVTAVIDEAI